MANFPFYCLAELAKRLFKAVGNEERIITKTARTAGFRGDRAIAYSL